MYGLCHCLTTSQCMIKGLYCGLVRSETTMLLKTLCSSGAVYLILDPYIQQILWPDLLLPFSWTHHLFDGQSLHFFALIIS